MPIINTRNKYILEPDDLLDKLYTIRVFKNGNKLRGVLKLDLINKKAYLYSRIDNTGKAETIESDFDNITFEAI